MPGEEDQEASDDRSIRIAHFHKKCPSLTLAGEWLYRVPRDSGYRACTGEIRAIHATPARCFLAAKRNAWSTLSSGY